MSFMCWVVCGELYDGWYVVSFMCWVVCGERSI